MNLKEAIETIKKHARFYAEGNLEEINIQAANIDYRRAVVIVLNQSDIKEDSITIKENSITQKEILDLINEHMPYGYDDEGTAKAIYERLNHIADTSKKVEG